MSIALPPTTDLPDATAPADVPTPAAAAGRPQGAWGMALRSGRVVAGGGVLLLILLLCLVPLPWALSPETQGKPPRYEQQTDLARRPPRVGVPAENSIQKERITPAAWFGYDMLGRSLLVRCLLGGTI